MFGLGPDGTERPAAMDLVRLAIPRRTYTHNHLDYVIEVVSHVAQHKDQISGLQITHQPPRLRHFSAQFAPIKPVENAA